MSTFTQCLTVEAIKLIITRQKDDFPECPADTVVTFTHYYKITTACKNVLLAIHCEKCGALYGHYGMVLTDVEFKKLPNNAANTWTPEVHPGAFKQSGNNKSYIGVMQDERKHDEQLAQYNTEKNINTVLVEYVTAYLPVAA